MKLVVILGSLVMACGPALSADQPKRQVLAGHFFLYSGEIGDWAAPKPKDTKLFLELEGAAAQQLYAALGAALNQPTEDANVMSRARGDLSCTFDKSAKAEAAYACYTGLDLKTGKSVNSTVE